MLSLVHHDLVFCEMIKMHSVVCLFNCTVEDFNVCD